jgi:MYXO-CTERM domain-containing protein
MMKTTLCSLTFLGATVVAALPSGQAAPLADFEGDEPLAGWTLIDQSATAPWGPNAFDIVEEPDGNHALRMHFVGELQPPGTPWTPLMALWSHSFVSPNYANGYVRAQVKVDEVNTVGGVALGDLASGFGYNLSMVALDENIDHVKAGRQFHIDRFSSEGTDPLKWLSGRDDGITFQLGEWWNVELGVVGARISAKVWEARAAEPAEPQFVWLDPERIPGQQVAMYSLVQSQLMSAPSRADASFDNFAFRIPEPTGLGLAAIGLAGLAACRRRRETDR